MRWYHEVQLVTDTTPPTPLAQDRKARRLWRYTICLVLGFAALAAAAYWIFERYSLGSFQLLFTWCPLLFAAILPQLLERSINPFLTSRTRYIKDSIVIKGSHESVGRLITGYLLWILTIGTVVSGILTRQPIHAATYALATAFMAYYYGTRRSFSDLLIALRDKQTTTLTPEGIVFRFPPRLSFESHKRDAEVTILWKQGIHIGSVEEHIIYLSNISREGPWDLCADHIGIPYTGLDALMRHFNEHSEDHPLLATPEGVDLVNQVLTDAHKTLTSSTRR